MISCFAISHRTRSTLHSHRQPFLRSCRHLFRCSRTKKKACYWGYLYIEYDFLCLRLHISRCVSFPLYTREIYEASDRHEKQICTEASRRKESKRRKNPDADESVTENYIQLYLLKQFVFDSHSQRSFPYIMWVADTNSRVLLGRAQRKLRRLRRKTKITKHENTSFALMYMKVALSLWCRPEPTETDLEPRARKSWVELIFDGTICSCVTVRNDENWKSVESRWRDELSRKSISRPTHEMEIVISSPWMVLAAIRESYPSFNYETLFVSTAVASLSPFTLL